MKRIPLLTSLYEDRNAIFELARKDVKQQYRGSVLGFVWTILHPLLDMFVMWVIFRKMFGRDDPYYVVYLLTGNILFAAFRASTDQSLVSIVNNRGLLLRTKMHPYLFPVSKSVASMTNFFYSLVALIPFMIYLSITQGVNLFSYQVLFIFLMLPAFWMFELGLGFLLSAIYVFFRDIRHLYSVLLSLWMYLTPIFYKIDMIKDSVAETIIKINPMYQFVDYFRQCTYSAVISNSLPSWSTLGILYLCGILSILIGGLIYKALKGKIIMSV